MTDDKKTLKFQMMMSPNEAKELDDWMFENRVRSRAEAIRRLCQIGLAADKHFIPMCDGYVDVFNAALDVASQTDNESEATRIFDSVSKIAESFTRLRGAIIPMRGNEEIEKSLAEVDEYRLACEQQDLSPSQAMLSLWKAKKNGE